jgi:predicted AAA+ superfamily ATPase
MANAMLEILTEQVLASLRRANPWWSESGRIRSDWEVLRPRRYLAPLVALVELDAPRRAVVLLGSRRVGKTVLLHHLVAARMHAGAAPATLIYISLDVPTYAGKPLEALIQLGLEASGSDTPDGKLFLFDEIQYLANWEQHLKVLVDTYPRTRFVASGSAAAALRLKSIESGAGRFTDYYLPPLKFSEFLELRGRPELAAVPMNLAALSGDSTARRDVIAALNREFIEYANFGGFPEAVVDAGVRADPARYLRNDVIDKVLLRDLPSLYGIDDIAELNRFFTVLTYNTGQEVSMEQLSKASGVAKNTVRKYLEYLEAAFLVERLNRIDGSARHFRRQTTFKVYLTNSSMRSALFEPESDDGANVGALIETAMFAQFRQSTRRNMSYARWDGARAGEIDFVIQTANRHMAIEVKWSDSAWDRKEFRERCTHFCKRNDCLGLVVTSRTRTEMQLIDDLTVLVIPNSLLALAASRGHVAGDLQELGFLTASAGSPE